MESEKAQKMRAGAGWEIKNMKNKELSGYFTIEAAFLMPVFICVIALLCYLGFYMCNRVLLLQDVYTAGLRGSLRQDLTNEETAAYTLQQSKGSASKYYAVRHIDRQVQVTGRKISVAFECEMQIPALVLTWENGKLINKKWIIKEKKSVDRTNPTTFIRVCRKVEKALENGQGK